MGASFRGANLSEAFLTNAKFWITNLAQAKLSNTDFTNATMGYSFFEFLDLRGAKGLETVNFTGPLSIGVETLYLSKGEIPTSFLRNAGVPENLVEYIPSLVGVAIDFYTCFISFAEKDYGFAEKLRKDLQNVGVRCWLWKEDAKIGHDMWKSIDTAIRAYDKLIVVCSEHSLTSPAVLREVERALQKEDDLLRQGNDFEVLFPIRLDDYVINEWNHQRKVDVTRKRIGDFRNWREGTEYRKELDRLLASINKQSKS